MKRLILCCDGTWNAADSAEVSNISKLALAIETREPVPARPRAPGDDTHQGPWDEPVLQQVVHYITGVGSRGYLADRILGGAFGYGFTSNVNEGYRVLCMNYDDGDEIYLFGFSRGAYTARSIGGMVSSIGLLTPQALLGHQDGNKLDEAERLYRDRRPGYKERRAEFRRASCRDGVRIEFLGVFDTVGALGVPGPARRRNQFHDVRLPDTVQCARQALAIDERRMTFEPCVWTVPDPPGRTTGPARGSAGAPRERVRQVWFEGVHSDVGGGYPDSALSDTALSWMVHEAAQSGLWFDHDALGVQYGSDTEAVCHDSLNVLYRVVNAAKRMHHVLDPHRRFSLRRAGPYVWPFRGDRRVLHNKTDGLSEHVSLSSCAYADWSAPDAAYKDHARNIGWWHDDLAAGSTIPQTRVDAFPRTERVLRILRGR